MSTEEVAARLIELCHAGQFIEAIEQLYADDVCSREMPGLPSEILNGKLAVTQKNQQWMANVETLHHCHLSDPIIAGEYFTVKMDLEVTFKEGPQTKLEEICVYRVRSGKIVSEQFFYSA